MAEVTYSVENFPYQKLYDYEYVRKHSISYLNVPCAFDIETTTIECKYRETCKKMSRGECNMELCEHWEKPVAFMYHWQFCIDKYVVFGRTWKEFDLFLKKIKNRLGLHAKRRMAVYVHNLSFEFQFLRGLYEIKDMFAREKRKPIRFRIDCFEFRCSYILSNMSLQKWCQNCEGVEHAKAQGDLDYRLMRGSKTPLTKKETGYCYNDVRGLCECLSSYLKEDTIASIPMTSTGFVRRDCRNAMKKNERNRKRFLREQLTEDQYILCRECFRGGNTHANYVYANVLLRNIESYDMASAYPYVMLTKKFPGAFISENPEKLWDYYCKEDYSFMCRIRFRNIRFQRKHGIPYIDVAHCQVLKDAVRDNGRVLEASELCISVTNIDFMLISQMYIFREMEVFDLYVARNDYLPKELTDTIMKYFSLKTNLKGIADKVYEYMKSKNKLNGIYGMMVTDILSNVITYDGVWKESAVADIQAELDRYYNNRNSFLSYQHGVWVTAYARQALQEGIDICSEDTVYTDTDSVKTFEGHREEFKKLNEKRIAEMLARDIYIEKDGKKIFLGIFEYEGTYDEFITLGAKKYCVKEDGAYKTTVSGLGKKEGAEHINKYGIEHFCEGEVFYPSGRLTAFYNDEGETVTFTDYTGLKHKMEIPSNLALIPSTYRLGITDEYKDLLNEGFKI